MQRWKPYIWTGSTNPKGRVGPIHVVVTRGEDWWTSGPEQRTRAAPTAQKSLRLLHNYCDVNHQKRSIPSPIMGLIVGHIPVQLVLKDNVDIHLRQTSRTGPTFD